MNVETDVLQSLAVVLLTSAVSVFLLRKISLPPIVGFLLSGVLIGPNGLGVLRDVHMIEIMAEIGVVLLLFTIGIEFSLSQLIRIRKTFLGGGLIQVLLTICLTTVVTYAWTHSLRQSAFFGFLVALSSTAIVLKIVSEKGELDTPHGRVTVGILIFQDLFVVFLMVIIPALAGEDLRIADIGIDIAKASFIIAFVVLSARWAVPVFLHQVVQTRSRELFITVIILLCIGTALITSHFGLSLALGAFLAGLVISESEYAHQAMSDILPFKESFMGIFFVSVGMLLDLSFMKDNLLTTFFAVALIFVMKVVTGVVAALITGSQARVAIQAGMGLAQIGEFSFVLGTTGRSLGIIPYDYYQFFLSAAVVTMIATPFVIESSATVAVWAASRQIVKRLQRSRMVPERHGPSSERQGHVVIIGFGMNGRNLARGLKEASIPYIVLDLNSDTVRKMKKKGEPIYYGDGTSPQVLNKMGIERARLLVVAISDPSSSRRITAIARKASAQLSIIVRTKYVTEVEDLKSLGADEVIPEELETSIEIFSRVLERYRVPHGVIDQMIDAIRKDNYRPLRSVAPVKTVLFERADFIPEMAVDGYKIPEGSLLAGKSISELQIRKRTGATIIAVRRGPDVVSNPRPNFVFEPGDTVLFTGTGEQMIRALECLKDDVRNCPPNL